MERALEGRLTELRTAGLFETELSEHLSHTCQWLVDFENRFRMPERDKLSMLTSKFLDVHTDSRRNLTQNLLTNTVTSMREPWFDIDDELGSLQAIVELRRTGELTSGKFLFHPDITEEL